IAAERPGTGACTLATAMELWLWTLTHLQKATDAEGGKLYHGTRQGVTFPLADALCWLLASRCQILDVLELEEKGPSNPVVAEGLGGLLTFLTDLCHVQAARAAGEVGRICAELTFGYNRHPAWEGASCGASGGAQGASTPAGTIPVISDTPKTDFDGFAPYQPRGPKAGPCCSFEGLEEFLRLRLRMDGCLTGARLAKDRAAAALTTVMIPEALDYPR
ncbi:MAG TPA: acyl-CoA dehydrogenase, partial [Candidatus Methylomirabilis sp.]|nr:acyl-CoA dehydrogenase [Candidatus Methylomirabilis sp.]